MPHVPAQRHQIEQDAITSLSATLPSPCCARSPIWKKNDDSHVILEADTNGHDDLMSRTSSFLAVHD